MFSFQTRVNFYDDDWRNELPGTIDITLMIVSSDEEDSDDDEEVGRPYSGIRVDEDEEPCFGFEN